MVNDADREREWASRGGIRILAWVWESRSAGDFKVSGRTRNDAGICQARGLAQPTCSAGRYSEAPMYLLAIIVPPIAVLFAGKPIQALLSFFLTLLGWVPGVIHALFVVANSKADKRNHDLIRAINASKAA